LLEVVAIRRKNAGQESDTPPLLITTALKKLLHSTHALFALSCPPLGGEEKRGEREEPWGGGGGEEEKDVNEIW
jgi:hypothetical protein